MNAGLRPPFIDLRYVGKPAPPLAARVHIPFAEYLAARQRVRERSSHPRP
ncbi:hypothetical protein KNT97_gp26 [Gordonia phage Rofo]|uniref:Uncharacterized protein n=1 Tax=Gordonia phage Rofo TaxID=2250396 RepID=A0A345KUA1_9CAUD|nr:hypothetical protein KNT97_gp26 [Gordonia phage Rofo]AXH46603.1 hypothetical protein SEA_ROFO_26 [Gordonia phage Rofo]